MALENYFFLVVRTLCCFGAVVLSIVFMIRADGDALTRRIVGALGLAALVFNKWLSGIIYKLLASILMSLLGCGLVILVILVILSIILLPVTVLILSLKEN